MALPTVAFNSSGSDTAASGAGPATALFGTAAATAGSTLVTLLVDNPDLSGVATDGSAVIWIGSSSGRQFAKITGVDNTAGVKTVTVANAYSNTESGKSWGIGGKRKTLAASTRLFQDILAGWTVDVQTGPQTLTASITWNVAGTRGSEMLLTSTAGTPPLITTATNSVNLFSVGTLAQARVKNLSFSNTAGTRAVGFIAAGSNCSSLTFENCVFDGFTNALEGDNVTNFKIAFLVMQNCEVKNCTVDGVKATDIVADNCNFHDNTSDGIQAAAGTHLVITNCTFTANGGDGLNSSAANTDEPVVLVGNTFRNNTGLGVDLVGANRNVLHTGNVYWGNGTFDIRIAATNRVITSYNAYGAAGQSGVGAGPGDVTLSAEPGVSGSDNTLNSTAGGGASCKIVGLLPKNAAATSTGRDLGAVPTGGGATATSGFVARRTINAGGAPSPVAAW